MVRRMLYLCLGPGCSIRPGLRMDPDCTAEAGITPPPRQAPVCWHLKNQIALSSETWGVKGSSLVSRAIERKYVVVKKRKSIEGNTPHPVRWGRWVSKLPPPSIPSSFFFSVQAGAAESAFSQALAQINCQRKSVSNMSVSCERRKTSLHTKHSLWGVTVELLRSSLSFSASCSTAPTQRNGVNIF